MSFNTFEIVGDMIANASLTSKTKIILKEDSK